VRAQKSARSVRARRGFTRSDISGEILATPKQAGKSRRRLAISGRSKHGGAGFSDDRQHLGRTGGNSVADFQRRQIAVQTVDIAGRAALRQHDAIGPAANHRGEIKKGIRRLERIDANEHRFGTTGLQRYQT
jgi:hypothetical protein